MQNTWKEKKFFVFVKFVRFVENEKWLKSSNMIFVINYTSKCKILLILCIASNSDNENLEIELKKLWFFKIITLKIYSILYSDYFSSNRKIRYIFL